VLRRAEEHLSEQAAELEGVSGIRPQFRASMGYPALTLAGIAEEEEGTLLVVGSRGLNTIKRAMLGSTSSNVLKTFEGSVLVVPPPDRQVDQP
jgi:nucleotide-binding universal stress UspA family protein